MEQSTDSSLADVRRLIEGLKGQIRADNAQIEAQTDATDQLVAALEQKLCSLKDEHSMQM